MRRRDKGRDHTGEEVERGKAEEEEGKTVSERGEDEL